MSAPNTHLVRLPVIRPRAARRCVGSFAGDRGAWARLRDWESDGLGGHELENFGPSLENPNHI